MAILSYGILLNAGKAGGGPGLRDQLLPGLLATIAQVLEQDQRKLVRANFCGLHTTKLWAAKIRVQCYDIIICFENIF
jgi:hypothetical protein